MIVLEFLRVTPLESMYMIFEHSWANLWPVFLNLNCDRAHLMTNISPQEWERGEGRSGEETAITIMKQVWGCLSKKLWSFVFPVFRVTVGSTVLNHGFHFHWIFLSCLRHVCFQFKSSLFQASGLCRSWNHRVKCNRVQAWVSTGSWWEGSGEL